MLRLKGTVVLLVVGLAMLSLIARADERVGTIGKVQGTVLEKFSVSIIGMNADIFQRQFRLLADQEGQPVALKDWGGQYQVNLVGGQEPSLDISLDLSRFDRRGYLRTGFQDIITWRLTADIKVEGDLVDSVSTMATGLRSHLNAGRFSDAGSITLNVWNGWLGQSLQGQTVRDLVPKLLHRLQDLENRRIANLPRDNNGKPVEEIRRYTLISILTNVQVAASLGPLGENDEIAVIRGGRQIGTLKVGWFDASHTKVWVAGDLRLAQQKGAKLKVL